MSGRVFMGACGAFGGSAVGALIGLWISGPPGLLVGNYIGTALGGWIAWRWGGA